VCGRTGDVVVRSQRYLMVYMCIVFITTGIEVIGEFVSSSSASSATSLTTFLVVFRLATFFNAACFMRMWLEAYRPRW
jgi:hypothetical protein